MGHRAVQLHKGPCAARTKRRILQERASSCPVRKCLPSHRSCQSRLRCRTSARYGLEHIPDSMIRSSSAHTPRTIAAADILPERQCFESMRQQHAAGCPHLCCHVLQLRRFGSSKQPRYRTTFSLACYPHMTARSTDLEAECVRLLSNRARLLPTHRPTQFPLHRQLQWFQPLKPVGVHYQKLSISSYPSQA